MSATTATPGSAPATPGEGKPHRARSAAITAFAVGAAVIIASGAASCSSASAARPGPSALVKRTEALNSAYVRAHPELVKCVAATYVLLARSWLNMQHGAPGVPEQAVSAEYGPQSAVATSYLPFSDALASYAAIHGTRGNAKAPILTVAGAFPGWVLRNGKPHYVSGPLGNTCQEALSSAHPQQAPAYPPPERPGFASALGVWKQSAIAASASRSLFLRRAAADLTAAGNPGYTVAVQELTNLAGIPETGLTSAQMAKAHADIAALDSFFGTPGLALSSQVPGPAASPGCPSSAELLTAWNAAPPSAFKSQGIAPGLPVSGFSTITCSQGWVMAYPSANANGYALFSERGALHMLSAADMRQFNSTVCSSPSTPAAWKNPVQGPCG